MPVSSRYRWNLQPAMTARAMDELSCYPRILQKLLYNRAMQTRKAAEVYLKQSGSLFSPFELDSMGIAVETILAAIDDGTPIAVYGDYDVDGVTATTILVQVLRKMGSPAISYIPNRFDEGYGLNRDALQNLYNNGIRLVITVDCGIRSVSEVEFARTLGLEMIISDHHEPGVEIPRARAVICPKKPGDRYPEKNLAGVGLAYKITEALLNRRPTEGIEAEDWIDLAAIGTVADIVPLSAENRSLVKAGLMRMRTFPRVPIRALAAVADFPPSEIKASTIGFVIGPRLNASGRLETAQLSLDLLMSENMSEASTLAAALNEQNKQRQELTRSMQKRASESVDREHLPYVILARDESFNMGVVGLAASKITDSFYRPSIVGAINGETTRASCRSIPEFSMIEALDQCSELMEKYGGHAMAAGLTVRNENWDALNERLNSLAAAKLGQSDLQPTRTADMEVDLDYLNKNVLDVIGQLEPVGQENPEPVFIVRNLHARTAKKVGSDQSHLKLTLVSDTNITIDGIAFSQACWADEMPDKIDVMCTLERNVWQNRESLQLRVIDIRPAMSEQETPHT